MSLSTVIRSMSAAWKGSAGDRATTATAALLNGLRKQSRKPSSFPLPTGFPLRPRDVVGDSVSSGPTVRRGGKERLPERIKKMKGKDLSGRRFSPLFFFFFERRTTAPVSLFFFERRTTNDGRPLPPFFHSPAGGGETSLLDVSPGGAAPLEGEGTTERDAGVAVPLSAGGTPAARKRRRLSASTGGVRLS